jgi:hypothetical protein
MNDMKEDARGLFDIARRAHEPTSREHERVLRGVLARGAIAAGVTSASVGSAAAKGLQATSRVASTLKIFAGFAILGATGAGAYRVSTAERAPSAVHAALPSPGKQDNGQKLVRALENQAPVQVAPAPEQSPNAVPKPRAPSSPGAGVVERTGHEVAETPAAPDEHAVARSPVASPPAAPSLAATQSFATSAPPSAATSEPARTVTLTREARALADVQRELREGRNTEALVMLAVQNREFAGGALGQEREAARIMALCAAGRVAEGRPAAERFLTANPGSPVATHIRSSCGVP